MYVISDPIHLCFGPAEVEVVPPITPLAGQGWGVVIANLSPCWLQVTTPDGTRWQPEFTSDLYGSGCNSCSLRFRWQLSPAWDDDLGGFVLLTWAQETSWFAQQSYPQLLNPATVRCGA